MHSMNFIAIVRSLMLVAIYWLLEDQSAGMSQYQIVEAD